MQRSFPSSGHYHLHVHTISKLKYQSALAAAAYRRGERFDRKEPEPHSITHAAAYQRAQQLGNNGQVFDYRRKIGVAWTGILAPEVTRKELLDAQTLWNTVERIEHRTNARLAREMIIALPHQVGMDVQITMLQRFITANLVSRGMIADVAIHRPPAEHCGDPRNWHAHVLLTDRPMTPTGFAATKDRNWNARENVTLWRKAWADTHNAMMAELGLPYRIDHRSLEAQRQDALQRNDTIAALDLDRTPQIHVGKAAYGTHPGRTIYRERREQNRAILTHNKNRAFGHKDRLESAIARADTAAYLEARSNAEQLASWQPPEPELKDLVASYGRPAPTTLAAELATASIRASAQERAMAMARDLNFPWVGEHTRPGAPSLSEVLLPTVKDAGPGHPLFSVTAKDLAFAFYNWGFTSLHQLQTALEDIADEEQRLFAARIAKKPTLRPPPPLPKAKSPTFPTPEAERLKRLQRAVIVHQVIYQRRLQQIRTYEARQVANPKSRLRCQGRRGQALYRRMTTQPFS